LLFFDEILNDIEKMAEAQIDFKLSAVIHAKVTKLLSTIKPSDYDQLFKAMVLKFAAKDEFDRMSRYFETLNSLRNNDLKKEIEPVLQAMYELAYRFLKPLQKRELFTHFTHSFSEFEALLKVAGTLSPSDLESRTHQVIVSISTTIDKLDKTHPGLFPHDF
jgi:hypothetical protein